MNLNYLNSHRPSGFFGACDKFLPKLYLELKRHLQKAQTTLESNTFHLNDCDLNNLATAVIEFAEDVHNNIGIWRSYEAHNLDYFNTSIPLILPQDQNIGVNPFNRFRVQHLVWVLYSELKQDLVFSPTHRDLIKLSEVISDYISDAFKKMPQGSGVKTFLTRSGEYAWDLKRKLLWLGQHSYLFRLVYRNYIETHKNEDLIGMADDFVCQESTPWSGLGAIDILSEVLSLKGQQKQDLLSWNERHFAYYEVLSVSNSRQKLKNLINDNIYTLRIPSRSPSFEPQKVYFGSLVPWNMEWYWSGMQYILGEISETEKRDLRSKFLRKSSNIAYRYCSDLLQKSRDNLNVQYDAFLKSHGDVLAVYPDGLSMAADQQREYKLLYKSFSSEKLLDVMEKHKLKNPWPEMSFPSDLLEDNTGVGVFFNVNEGLEIMGSFNHIISGLQKRGKNLTQIESEGIASLMCSKAISPQFIEKMVERYGCESFASVFFIQDPVESHFLQYLLRRYKGHFYKNRYPSINLVN